MPETINISESEIQEAASNFYPDFQKVMQFHERIQALEDYRGRSQEFDASLRSIVARQKDLMFGLRNLYADAYELLPPAQRSIVFKWIVKATGELKQTSDNLGQLGIVPIIIIAGVIITAATATALVAWHRAISVQGKALDNQAQMIRLVAEGKLPPEVLKPGTTTTIAESLSSFGTVLLLIAIGYIGLQLYKTWQTK